MNTDIVIIDKIPQYNANINDRITWMYPDILSGITIIRKENVTQKEIYEIYKYCINIQREALIRKMNSTIEPSS